MDERYRLLEIKIRAIERMVSEIYDQTVKDKKHCPVCDSTVRVFLADGDPIRQDVRCPVCGSFERHRAMFLFLKQRGLLLNGDDACKVLHFAPEQCVYDVISGLPTVDYFPVDIDDTNDLIRDAIDITDINYGDNTFDYIICNHVLEHVPKESLALKELFRVLRLDGKCILSVPIKKGMEETLENEAYNTKELRKKYYGQEDHVRLYGEDFIDRVRKAGFICDMFNPCRDMTDSELKKYGVNMGCEFYFCRKPT